MEEQEPVVEDVMLRIRFPVIGSGKLKTDHNASLYGAISKLLPEVHGLEGVGISPIEGTVFDGEHLALTKRSGFTLQLPNRHLPLVLPLAGRSLKVADTTVVIGPPQVRLIAPADHLAARFVSVKNKTEPEQLQEYISRVLRERFSDELLKGMEIRVGRRRVVSLHGKKIVGFGVRLSGLKPEVSVGVQSQYISGRTRYGSGLFFPWEADR